MSVTVRVLLAAVVGVLATNAPGQAQPAADGGADYRAGVAGAAQELARQLELVQEAIAYEPVVRQGRGLWTQSEKVTMNLVYLQQQLKRGASRADLYTAFAELDTRLQELLGEINLLGVQEAPLKRAAARARLAEIDLHYAVFAGDGSEAGRVQMLVRQALALGAAAQQLENLGRYVLDGQDLWTYLGPDLLKLRQAAADFQKSVEARPDREQLLRQFARLQKAWQDLTVDYALLPRGTSLLMGNYAARLDGIYGRLYGLVGLKGDRAKLAGGS